MAELDIQQNSRIKHLPYWQPAFVLNCCACCIVVDVGQEEFDRMFSRSGTVRYRRCGGVDSHYKRDKDRPLPPHMSAYDLFTHTWVSESNQIRRDFNIYGIEEDLIMEQNPWHSSDYDDCGVGYPRNASQLSLNNGGLKWFRRPFCHPRTLPHFFCFFMPFVTCWNCCNDFGFDVGVLPTTHGEWWKLNEFIKDHGYKPLHNAPSRHCMTAPGMRHVPCSEGRL